MTHEKEAEDLDVHVAVCAERYKSLEYRLDRIERVLWWSTTILMTGMGGIIFKLITLRGII